MKDLIERLEKATGPDRELDCAIYGAAILQATLPPETARDVASYMKDFPIYTSSIDAALTLVPEGGRIIDLREWCSNPGWPDNYWFWSAGVHLHPNAGYAKAPTAAIALCIAALKARESVK